MRIMPRQASVATEATERIIAFAPEMLDTPRDNFSQNTEAS